MLQKSEMMIQQIKDLLCEIKKEKGLTDLIRIQEALQTLLSNPEINSQVLKEIFTWADESLLFSNIAYNLSYRYKLIHFGGIKVYQFVENLRRDILIYCLSNPNYPEVYNFLQNLVAEYIWNILYKDRVTSSSLDEDIIFAIKAILVNPVLPLEIIEQLPDAIIPSCLQEYTYRTFYIKGEGLILESEIGKRLLEPFTQEERDILLKLL